MLTWRWRRSPRNSCWEVWGIRFLAQGMLRRLQLPGQADDDQEVRALIVDYLKKARGIEQLQARVQVNARH